jgi:predicted PurR-regulated permease PerM
MEEKNHLDEENSDIPLEVLPARWETPARYLAAGFLIVGVVLLVCLLIPIFQIVAWSFMFAFVFFMPIQKIVSHFHIRYPMMVVIFYLLIAILFGWLAYEGLKYFATGINNLSGDMIKANTGLMVNPSDFTSQILKNIAVTSSTLVENLKSVVSSFVSGIGVIVTAFILSLILMLNLNQARGSLAEWIPTRYQAEITQVLFNFDHIWVGYIFANVIYGAAVGLGSFVEYRLLGVPYPFVMAVITGVITPIPSIGGLLASLIVAVPCYFLGSTVFVDMSYGTFTLIVTFINVAITQASYYFVALPVIGKLAQLPTALVFIGVTAALVTGNILLAFLSVPILSTILIIGTYVLSKILHLDRIPGQKIIESTEPGFFSQLLLKKPD